MNTYTRLALLVTILLCFTFVNQGGASQSSIQYVDDSDAGSADWWMDAKMLDGWNLDRIDQRNLPFDGVYHYNATGKGVRIYIVGSGIRTNNWEFRKSDGVSSRAIPGISTIRLQEVYPNAENPTPLVPSEYDSHPTTDDCGHETHVAGIAGGSYFGVAKDATLISVRTAYCDMSQKLKEEFIDARQGVEYVTAQKKALGAHTPVVANFSTGFSCENPYSCTDNEKIELYKLNYAIAKSIREGVIWVVSAGNNNEHYCNREFYPENLNDTSKFDWNNPKYGLESLGDIVPELIVVGATDPDDTRGRYPESLHPLVGQPSYYSNMGACLDLFAPGTAVRSAGRKTESSYPYGYDDQGVYGAITPEDTFVQSGTSMAAPLVSGVVALYLEDNPSATPQQVRDALLVNASRGTDTTPLVKNRGEGSPDLLLYGLLAEFSLTRPEYSVNERSSSIAIEITRRGNTDRTASVRFETANGTATAGSDYAAVSQRVSFAPGEVSKAVSVPILQNSIDSREGDETVTLRLSEPSVGGTFGIQASSKLTIQELTPQLLSNPTISGNVRETQTISTNGGVWSSQSSYSLAYTWQYCDAGNTVYGSANATSLRLDNANVRVRVKVTATNGYGSTNAYSTCVGPVAVAYKPTLQPGGNPTIALSGSTLSTNGGTWNGDPPSWPYSNYFTFNWYWAPYAGSYYGHPYCPAYSQGSPWTYAGNGQSQAKGSNRPCWVVTVTRTNSGGSTFAKSGVFLSPL